MISTIVGCVGLLVIFVIALQMIWNTLVVAYRVTMIVILGTLYIAITIWEIASWIVLLPFRVARWIHGFLPCR